MKRRIFISYQNLWNTVKAIFSGKYIAYSYNNFVTKRLLIPKVLMLRNSMKNKKINLNKV